MSLFDVQMFRLRDRSGPTYGRTAPLGSILSWLWENSRSLTTMDLRSDIGPAPTASWLQVSVSMKYDKGYPLAGEPRFLIEDEK